MSTFGGHVPPECGDKNLKPFLKEKDRVIQKLLCTINEEL